MKRSFTLIETLLAATLGTLVLLVVVAIIGVLDRADSGSVDRLARAAELEQAQIVIRRAIGSMAMAGGSAPVSNRTGGAPAEPLAGQVSFTPTPRFVLAPMGMDPMLAAGTALGVLTTTTGTDATTSAAGELSVDGRGAQRLMVAVTSLPLPEQAFVVPGAVARSTRRALTGTTEESEAQETARAQDQEPTEEDAQDEEGADSELVPIFWGTFELTPPGPAPFDGRDQSQETGNPESSAREGWTLWWRPIEPPINPSAVEVLGMAALEPVDRETSGAATRTTPTSAGATGSPSLLIDPRMDSTAIPLIRGLEMCRWSVYRGRKLMPDYAATYSGELPAYVQLEIRTTSGVYANWMFEVGWATVREPAQIEAARLNQALASRGGGAGGAGGDREGGPVSGRPARRGSINRPGMSDGQAPEGDIRIQRQRRDAEGTGERRLPPRRPQQGGE